MHSAKISTIGERAVDHFEITDAGGAKLDESAQDPDPQEARGGRRAYPAHPACEQASPPPRSHLTPATTPSQAQGKVDARPVASSGAEPSVHDFPRHKEREAPAGGVSAGALWCRALCCFSGLVG